MFMIVPLFFFNFPWRRYRYFLSFLPLCGHSGDDMQRDRVGTFRRLLSACSLAYDTPPLRTHWVTVCPDDYSLATGGTDQVSLLQTSLFHVTHTYICMAQSKSMYCAHVLNGTSLVWLKHSTVAREHNFIDFFSSSSKQHHHCHLIRVLTSNEFSADLQWPTLSVSLLSHHVFPAASNPLLLIALWFMIILSSFFGELLICNLAIGSTGLDGAVGTQGDCPTRTVNHGPGSFFSMLIYSSLRLLYSRLFKGTVRLVSWPVSLCVLVQFNLSD